MQFPQSDAAFARRILIASGIVITLVAGLALLTVAFVDTLVDSLRAKSAILTDTGAE